jgi:hypothetical protein
LISIVNLIVKTPIEMGAEGSRKMGASREAENAHAVRVDLPLDGMAAENAESILVQRERNRAVLDWRHGDRRTETIPKARPQGLQ